MIRIVEPFKLSGVVERVQETILAECWKPAFARYLIPKYTGLRLTRCLNRAMQPGGLQYQRPGPLTLAQAGFGECRLHDRIEENPSILGLGDVIHGARAAP